MVGHPALWLGAVALVLWGLRYALHRGLAPESAQAGVQPLACGALCAVLAPGLGGKPVCRAGDWCPALLLHGRRDDLVPVDDVRQLWQRPGALAGVQWNARRL